MDRTENELFDFFFFNLMAEKEGIRNIPTARLKTGLKVQMHIKNKNILIITWV